MEYLIFLMIVLLDILLLLGAIILSIYTILLIIDVIFEIGDFFDCTNTFEREEGKR